MSSNPLPQLVYIPLDPHHDSIRVLELLPSLTADGKIQCNLINTRRSLQRNRFTALSYTWGAPTPVHSIIVNHAHFEVRENLFDFLETMQKQLDTDPLVLWIDGICIDQNSLTERTHQVRQMGEIYKDAKLVYAWLGLSTAATDELFPLLLDDHERGQDGNSSSGFSMDKHSGYVDICKREYWTRLWIVQEIILAREIVLLCGTSTVGWARWEKVPAEIEREARNEVYSMGNLPGGYYGIILSAFLDNDTDLMAERVRFLSDGRREQDTRHLSMFEDAWFSHYKLGCAVPQDRVYALLNLVQVRHGVSMKPSDVVDYEQHPLQLLQRLLSRFEFVNVGRFIQSFNDTVGLSLDDIEQNIKTAGIQSDALKLALPGPCSHKVFHETMLHLDPIDETVQRLSTYSDLADHPETCTLTQDSSSRGPLSGMVNEEPLFLTLWMGHHESPKPISLVLQKTSISEASDAYMGENKREWIVSGLHVVDWDLVAAANPEKAESLLHAFRPFASNTKARLSQSQKADASEDMFLLSTSFRCLLSLMRELLSFNKDAKRLKAEDAGRLGRMGHEMANNLHYVTLQARRNVDGGE